MKYTLKYTFLPDKAQNYRMISDVVLIYAKLAELRDFSWNSCDLLQQPD